MRSFSSRRTKAHVEKVWKGCISSPLTTDCETRQQRMPLAKAPGTASHHTQKLGRNKTHCSQLSTWARVKEQWSFPNSYGVMPTCSIYGEHLCVSASLSFCLHLVLRTKMQMDIPCIYMYIHIYTNIYSYFSRLFSPRSPHPEKAYSLLQA